LLVEQAEPCFSHADQPFDGKILAMPELAE